MQRETYSQKYYKKHKDLILSKQRIYRQTEKYKKYDNARHRSEEYKEKANKRRKKRRKINGREKDGRAYSDKKKEHGKRYYLKHRLEKIKKVLEYEKKHRKTDEYRIKRNQKYRIGTKRTIPGFTNFIKQLYYFKREVLNAAS
jgi:hypothetical protein